MSGPWRYAAASISGTSHVKSGTPCQDYAEIAEIEARPATGSRQALIAVASDGAGSATHSDQGARAICRAFLEFGRLGLEHNGCQPEFLQDGFETAVLEDFKRELSELSTETGERIEAFACTALGAFVGDDAALFIQLGDGAIAYRIEDCETWRIATSPQRGEFVNETIFVTRFDAAKHIRAVKIEARITEFALMTDGTEFLAVKQSTGTAHPPFFEYVFRLLRNTHEPGYSSLVADWITKFLDSEPVNRRTDDDKTLVLATREPLSIQS